MSKLHQRQAQPTVRYVDFRELRSVRVGLDSMRTPPNDQQSMDLRLTSGEGRFRTTRGRLNRYLGSRSCADWH
jgi:hypothetical protein